MLRCTPLMSCSWPFKSKEEIKENINNCKKNISLFQWQEVRLRRSTGIGIFKIHERPLWIHTFLLHARPMCWKSGLLLESCFLEEVKTGWWSPTGRNRPLGAGIVRSSVIHTLVPSCPPASQISLADALPQTTSPWKAMSQNSSIHPSCSISPSCFSSHWNLCILLADCLREIPWAPFSVPPQFSC